MGPGYQVGKQGILTGLRVFACAYGTKKNRKVDTAIVFDNGFQPAQLIGKWVHYAVVFDREQQKKVFVYINGKKQSNTLDISAVKGSVDNNKPLEFGYLYGWKTKGTLDEYRIYNKALDEFEVAAIHKKPSLVRSMKCRDKVESHLVNVCTVLLTLTRVDSTLKLVVVPSLELD
ncbi:hypothetical protein OS493_034343 [Desmophyllum pertusum]|uniref:LamG domain-containing protein n=1 Tax=Desmophyllum pertusum TaxID=174260 RepID=A0A9W9Y7Z8_9CNID|nr:hypothetical protein OS493_034343 [Desmophyllum pertusum]